MRINPSAQNRKEKSSPAEIICLIGQPRDLATARNKPRAMKHLGMRRRTRLQPKMRLITWTKWAKKKLTDSSKLVLL